MAEVRVRAFLQRNAGSCKVRLWLLSTQRADLAWYKDMDFSQALRKERREQTEGNTWNAFAASFFGPDFQSVEAMSRTYDERTLNVEFTRAYIPVSVGEAVEAAFSCKPMLEQ